MNVGQLKKACEGVPDNTQVMLEQTNNEFDLSLVEQARVMEVTFSDGKLKAKDNCLVITDQAGPF